MADEQSKLQLWQLERLTVYGEGFLLMPVTGCHEKERKILPCPVVCRANVFGVMVYSQLSSLRKQVS